MIEVTGAEMGTDADYYRIRQSLPGETRDFVPAMIALARIGKAPPVTVSPRSNVLGRSFGQPQATSNTVPARSRGAWL